MILKLVVLSEGQTIQYVRLVLKTIAQASDMEGEDMTMWTELRLASRACVCATVSERIPGRFQHPSHVLYFTSRELKRYETFSKVSKWTDYL